MQISLINSSPSWHISSNVYEDPYMFKKARIETVHVQLTHMWHVNMVKYYFGDISAFTLTFSVDLVLEL